MSNEVLPSDEEGASPSLGREIITYPLPFLRGLDLEGIDTNTRDTGHFSQWERSYAECRLRSTDYYVKAGILVG